MAVSRNGGGPEIGVQLVIAIPPETDPYFSESQAFEPVKIASFCFIFFGIDPEIPKNLITGKETE